MVSVGNSCNSSVDVSKLGSGCTTKPWGDGGTDSNNLHSLVPMLPAAASTD